jgi:hypothetical protein
MLNEDLTRSMLKTVLLGFGIVIGLSTSTIFTPLWLDSMSDSSKTQVNKSGNSSTSSTAIDNYAVIFFVSVMNLLLSTFLIITILLIGKFMKTYHTGVNCKKGNMFCVGLADAVSTIFLVYAANGSRTAPYLQAIATNFAIPVTFLTRSV